MTPTGGGADRPSVPAPGDPAPPPPPPWAAAGPAPLPLPLPRLAAAEPGRLALRCAGRDLGYGALGAMADDRARRLAGLGVAPGDRVALWLGSSVAHVACLHAVARRAAVVVPLHARLTPGEAAWQAARVGARLVLVDDEASAARLGAALGDAEPAAGGGRPGPTVITLAGLAAAPPRAVALADHVPPGAAQAILFTSGTTGRPKGVVLSWGNQAAAAAASALRLGALPDDRWLAPLPLSHVGGLAVILRCAWAGAAVLLQEGFEAAAVARALEAEGATVASLVPTMLGRLLDARGDRPSPPGLRALLLGGGPAAPELLRRARRAGYPIAPTYGLTEAASQVATARPGAFDDDAPAAPPLPWTTIRVVDEAGRDAAPGALGEIWVRGPTVMAGYWDDPPATAAALAGGWLHTGDLGALDAAGRLRVAARRTDLVVSGGENVYPAEVEAALAEHPAVAAACVVGLADAEWGQRVAALVELRAGAAVTPADLEAHVRARLAGFKVPRRWRLLPAGALPRTASGKLRRDAARALAAAEAAEALDAAQPGGAAGAPSSGDGTAGSADA